MENVCKSNEIVWNNQVVLSKKCKECVSLV